jgi:hypothetical protein
VAYGPPSWRNLAGGIVALVMIIGGAFSIIAFARVGSLKGDKYTVYILADRANGIFKGTDVWLQGQKVGVVKSVGFHSGAAVSTVLRVEVMSSYKQFIRRDSPVEFKPGGTFVGAQVVALRVGSAAAPVLEAGDTLTRVLVIDPDFRSSELTAAGQDFPEIVTSLRSIGSDLSKTQSQFNSLAEHRSGLQVAIRHMSQFSLRKNGTLPLLARDRTLSERAKIAIERADSLLDFTREPGTLGRIRADTGFRRTLASARSELDSVRIRIAREDGAAGRFLADAQLKRDLEALSNEIARTLADFTRHPERFSPF